MGTSVSLCLYMSKFECAQVREVIIMKQIMMISGIPVEFDFVCKAYGNSLHEWSNNNDHISYLVIVDVIVDGQTILITSDFTIDRPMNLDPPWYKQEDYRERFLKDFLENTAAELCGSDCSKREYFRRNLNDSLDGLKAYKKLKKIRKHINKQLKHLSKEKQDIFETFLARCIAKQW